ncbi:MAG: hypothetical protein J3R72DRAFT_523067 [Linnemannia gamsii]|nr:MAG: hypothetical protein J3R72DRAFT_523067 [Linnemannia gamsii]
MTILIKTLPLQPSSPYYKPNNNAPPSYSVSLTATSQFAVNNPGGPSYLALITFPGNYVLSAVPLGCLSVSINTVNCTVAGMNQLIADFASVIVADGTSPRLDSVVVNGEICAVGHPCPRYSPTNPGIITTAPWASGVTLTSTIINPSPTLPSQPLPSSSFASSPSRSLSPSSTSSSSGIIVNPTHIPGDIPPPSEAEGSQKSKVGLIVGLTLALVLLIFLVYLYFYRRHRRNIQNGTSSHHRWSGAAAAAAAAALFRVKGKGSRLSLGRSSLHNSPNMASTSEPNLPPVSSYNEKVSYASEDPYIARPVSMSSTITGSENSLAMGTTGLGMTLVNIPEAHEPEDSSAVNYFQGENDEFERDLDAEFAEATTTTTELIHNKNNAQDSTAAASSTSRHPWLARAASKSARLHRAVSIASNRLLHSSHTPQRSSQELQDQQQHPPQRQQDHQQKHLPHRQPTPSEGRIPGPRFPRDGIFFRNKSDSPSSRSASLASFSVIRPPKSIHRSSSRGDVSSISSSSQVIGTIRPEHYQQHIHQQMLDEGLTPEEPLPSYAYRQLAAGATSEGTAANAAALTAAVSQGGLGFVIGGGSGGGGKGVYRGRSDSAGSAATVANLDPTAFINPGPPPQPPKRGMSRSPNKGSSSSISRDGAETGTRRGFNQPIHIRAPGSTYQPYHQQHQPQSQQRRPQQQMSMVSEGGGSGLYGYM